MNETADIAILRIELAGIQPLIWRRVAVWSESDLHELHRIIQFVMGWSDYHLWQFDIGDTVFGISEPDAETWGEDIRPAHTTSLAHIIGDGARMFGYTYDMGDGWEHSIIVERLKVANAGELYPLFLGGERRCPPEDCGGVPGYYEFLDTISGPDKGKGSRKKQDALNWYGGPFDPDEIDEDQIRTSLEHIARATGPIKPRLAK